MTTILIFFIGAFFGWLFTDLYYGHLELQKTLDELDASWERLLGKDVKEEIDRSRP